MYDLLGEEGSQPVVAIGTKVNLVTPFSGSRKAHPRVIATLHKMDLQQARSVHLCMLGGCDKGMPLLSTQKFKFPTR